MNASTGETVSASVIIPACNEQFSLARLLEAILHQELSGLRLEVVVVVNGSTDASASVADGYVDRFRQRGHMLVAADIPRASKARALNHGDTLATCFPRLYVDADVGLAPNAIARVVEELQAVHTPALAAPAIRVAESASSTVRGYSRVWLDLPYIRSHVPGVGFYAVNEAGRGRWWRFPTRVGADDKFVRLHFDNDEAIVIEDTWFTIFLPDHVHELVRVRARWISLNREITRHCPNLGRRDVSRWRSSARHILAAPSLWRDLPAFLVVFMIGWLLSLLRTAGIGPRWYRPATVPRRAPALGSSARLSAGPREAEDPPIAARASERNVHVVTVTYNSAGNAERCIESLLASEGLDNLRITVVDNASTDLSAHELAGRFSELEFISNEVNVGFAAAVNQVAKLSSSKWLALVNPDVEVHPDSLATCVDFLEQEPATGCCGISSVYADGTVNPRSYFHRPTFWSEITLGIGAHRIAPASRLLNPEQHSAFAQITSPIAVDAIAGCFVVIDTTLFMHLGGFDEQYFVCGEDLDLGLRAVEAGAAPTVVPSYPILHHSARSFGNRAASRVAYLRGRAQYERRWWSARSAMAAGALRRAGVLARLAALRIFQTDRKHELAEIWRRRHEWSVRGISAAGTPASQGHLRYEACGPLREAHGPSADRR